MGTDADADIVVREHGSRTRTAMNDSSHTGREAVLTIASNAAKPSSPPPLGHHNTRAQTDTSGIACTEQEVPQQVNAAEVKFRFGYRLIDRRFC